MVFLSVFGVKDPLHQGWCDGSLHFCISCTCGSSGRHAVLHVAGAPEARIRHQCWAAGTVKTHCFSLVFFCRFWETMATALFKYWCSIQVIDLRTSIFFSLKRFEFDLRRCAFLGCRMICQVISAQKSVACDHGVTHSGTSNWLLLCHFCLPLVVVGFRFCFGTALQNWVGNVSPQPQVPSARTGSNPALYRWRLKYFQPLELPRSWWSRGNLTCNDSATGAEIRWDAVRFHELWISRNSDGWFAMMWVKSETDSARSFRRTYVSWIIIRNWAI